MKMKKVDKILILLTIILFINQTHCELSVYMPQCGIKEITAPIAYTMANFGHNIPYGDEIVAKLVIPQNNKQLCDISTSPNYIQKGKVGILLIQRGGCKFTKKIYNAQQSNAILAIVYDNQSSTTPTIVMSNDGHGHLIDIPSIFISGTDGQRLKNTLAKCDTLTMKMIFQTFITDVAQAIFWLDSNHRSTYITLRQFKHTYYEALKGKMDLEIKFKVNTLCPTCKQTDCLVDGLKYCYTVPIQHESPIQGTLVLEEQLRQYFIFTQYKNTNENIWWQYMDLFDLKNCINSKQYKICVDGIMKELNIDGQLIQRNMANQISQLKSGKTQNSIIAKFAQDAVDKDILFYPEVTVNNKNFYGLFKAYEVFELICNSVARAPSQCKSFRDPYANLNPNIIIVPPQHDVLSTILIIFGVMLVSFVIILLIYTKIIRKQVNRQLSLEVNKMVQNYVSLTQQKSNSGKSHM